MASPHSKVGIVSRAHDAAASLSPPPSPPSPPPTSSPPPPGPTRIGRFGALAGWAQRHRWSAIALWVVVLVAIQLGSMSVGSAYKNNFSLPGSQSQAATDL